MKTSYDMIEEDIAVSDLRNYPGTEWELYGIDTSGCLNDIRRLKFIWRKKGYSE